MLASNANLPLGSITDRWFTWARILRKNGLKSILLVSILSPSGMPWAWLSSRLKSWKARWWWPLQLNLLAQLQDPLASHPCQPLPSGCPVIHSNDNQTSKYPNSMDIEAINLALCSLLESSWLIIWCLKPILPGNNVGSLNFPPASLFWVTERLFQSISSIKISTSCHHISGCSFCVLLIIFSAC